MPYCRGTRMPGGKYCANHTLIAAKERKKIKETEALAEKAREHFPHHRCLLMYFIRAGDGPVKIGVTADVEARVATLQTGNACKLSVLAVIPVPPEMEGKLHKALDAHRLIGEWFCWCAEVELLVALARENRVENIKAFAGW